MKKFFVALVGIAISGCVSVLPDAEPASARYFITDIQPSSSALNEAVWSLSIEDPSAMRAFDTTKIAVSQAPGKVEYYSGGEWSDRAPRLIGSALIRSFENTGQILAVGSRVTQPRADFVLQTDVRDLHVVKTDSGKIAKTSIYVRLTDGRSKVYAAKLFAREAAIATENTGRVAAQIDQNIAGIIDDVITWTFEEAESAQAK